MSHPRQRTKAFLQASLIALGILAISSSSAQGAAEMKVSGAMLKADETLEAVGATEELFVVPLPLSLVIHCKEVITHKKWLWLAFKFDRKHLLKGCVTLIGGSTSEACKPAEPVVSETVALPILHNGKNYLLIEPSTGSTLVNFNLGPNCPVAEELLITGTYVAECLTEGGASGDCGEELVKHSMRPAPASLFPSDGLKVGVNKVTIEGTESATLIGANKGKKWSVVS